MGHSPSSHFNHERQHTITFWFRKFCGDLEWTSCNDGLHHWFEYWIAHWSGNFEPTWLVYFLRFWYQISWVITNVSELVTQAFDPNSCSEERKRLCHQYVQLKQITHTVFREWLIAGSIISICRIWINSQIFVLAILDVDIHQWISKSWAYWSKNTWIRI